MIMIKHLLTVLVSDDLPRVSLVDLIKHSLVAKPVGGIILKSHHRGLGEYL
jgi:hypothetical protein